MSKRGDKNLIVGLDIGTSKVVAIVGEINDGGAIEVVGIGSHPSRGLSPSCRARRHSVSSAGQSPKGSPPERWIRQPWGQASMSPRQIANASSTPIRPVRPGPQQR